MNLSALFRRKSWLGGSRSNAIVGIEVAPSAVRAVRMHRDGDTAVLDDFRVTPRGRSGDDSLAEAVQRALELRVGGEPVAVALASRDVAIRKIELPPMSEQELRQALPWEARRHVAGLAEDAMLDAQVLSGTGTDGPMEVVLVAFPRALYGETQEALRLFAVEPAFVDVSPMASMNAILRLSRGGDEGPTALLDLGPDGGSFAIFSKAGLILFRDLGGRARQLESILAEPATAAAQPDQPRFVLKMSRKEGSGGAAFADFVNELAEDVRAGLLYLENRSGTSLDRVYLTGPYAAPLEQTGIAEAASGPSGAVLERHQPFQGLRHGPVDAAALRAVASELSPAAGLAARHLGL